MLKKTLIALAVPAAAVLLSACTSSPSSADYDKMTAEIVKASFQDRGIAKVDRLQQDMAN
jgi:sulfur-oxidizing protein SoxX